MIMPPSTENSGVLIRFPALNASDPVNDWKLPRTRATNFRSTTGYNPDSAPPQRSILCIRPAQFTPSLHPRRCIQPSWPVDTYDIEATATRSRSRSRPTGDAYTIPATESRGCEGHIGLQCHTGNVQFRNVLIRTLPGGIVIIPPNTPHRFVNSGDTTLRQIGIHASPRFIQTNLE